MENGPLGQLGSRSPCTGALPWEEAHRELCGKGKVEGRILENPAQLNKKM